MRWQHWAFALGVFSVAIALVVSLTGVATPERIILVNVGAMNFLLIALYLKGTR